MPTTMPGRNGGTLTRPLPGETMNLNGRPKKGISLVNDELAEEGYGPASKKDIEHSYMSLVQLGEGRLKMILSDTSKPMLVRILAKGLLDKKGFEIAERILDRGIGRPKQTEEITVKDPTASEGTLTEHQRALLEQAYKANGIEYRMPPRAQVAKAKRVKKKAKRMAQKQKVMKQGKNPAKGSNKTTK